MKYLFPIVGLLLLTACRSYLKDLTAPATSATVYRIMPNQQLLTGDPDAGLDYLINGDYIGSGIPTAAFESYLLPEPDTVLQRSGTSARLDYTQNAYTAFNGAEVISGNCFTCHASPFEGQVMLGLGNSFSSYQKNFKLQMGIFKRIVKKKVGDDSPEWEAFQTYAHINMIALPKIVTANPGVNPAFRLEEAYVSQRDPVDLQVQDQAVFDMASYVPASDVPPLWNLRKKDALYYNGMGRGDYAKLLMQASTQGVRDSSEAREIHDRFDDVVAWIASLEAPVWPKEINASLAATGKTLFEAECSKCHGKYGERETYPNKLVPLHEIQTDPAYARYFLQLSGLPSWYNRSWYAASSPQSELKASEGYIAPPLDGVWATAPYLHNGSVPNIEALLNSEKRPRYWSRPDQTYDYQHLGWKYMVEEKGKGKEVYDTTLPGYGNQGHYFGDTFTEEERRAVIEYVKTL